MAFSLSPAHYGHESRQGLQIGVIESSQIIEIQRGVKPGIFGFWGGKSRQNSFHPCARAMRTGCRNLIGQAQNQDRAAFFTTEAEIFVQRHGSYSSGMLRAGRLFGQAAIWYQVRLDSPGECQGKDRSGAGIS